MALSYVFKKVAKNSIVMHILMRSFILKYLIPFQYGKTKHFLCLSNLQKSHESSWVILEIELVGTGFRRPNEWTGFGLLIFGTPELGETLGN